MIKHRGEFVQELIKIEKQSIVKEYKFGILYCKDGQTEDEMYCNGTFFFFS